MRYIDLTHEIRPGMSLFPGTPLPEIRQIADCDSDGYAERQISLTTHTGTHMDAPAHVFSGGTHMGDIPISSFFGTAAVADCSGYKPGHRIVPADLPSDREDILKADFLLIRTGWEGYWGTEAYCSGFPCISSELADWLKDTGKRGVGIDTLSVEPAESDDMPVHKRLLSGSDFIILENLRNLERIGSGLCKIYAFPLPIYGADGAPARVIAETTE